ncbi:MAG: signal peptidase II [Nitrospirota bacterium]
MKNISILTLLLVLSDQATKFLATKYLSISKNTGIAFGIPIPQELLIIANIALLIVLFYFIKKELDLSHRLSQVLTAGVLAGGISNLGDRLYHGYVIDFIAVPYWPTFNLADIYITVGILLLIIFYGRLKNTREQSGRAAS